MTEANGTNGSEVDIGLVSEPIKKLFNNYLTTKGISDVSIEISPGSMKGDNYLGIIAKLVVKGKDKNGKIYQENFIIKSATKSEGFRKFAPIRLAYEREIYMYSVVLPAFKKFQEEKHIKNSFAAQAECLQTSNEEMEEALIMKDMKNIGFKLQNRKYALDYNHIKLVITELAKYHSISFALRDQKPGLFEEFASNMKRNYFTEMDLSVFQAHSRKQCEKAIGSLNPEVHKKAIEKFNIFKEKYIDHLISSLEDPCNPYSVIRHGDCWTNNFLFKYDDKSKPNKPTSLCFLDWQLSHIGPPVLDILYFTYACSDKKLRDEHFEDLLKHYYQVLKDFGKELGSDIEKLYPFSVLKEQLQKFGPYGVATAVMLLQFLLSDSDEIPDINTMFDESEDITAVMENFSLKSRNEEIYFTRIRDVILHAVEKNFI